jgi:large subunit ribosomal protein L16
MLIKKYKKYHHIKNIKKIEKKNLRLLKNGVYGLKTLKFGIITKKQSEAIRKAISRVTFRIGKVILNLCLNKPITKKPLLSRMGKGSGAIHS